MYVIMIIKAVDTDLIIEAERLDYDLQVSNHPFDTAKHGNKIKRIKAEIGGKILEDAKDESLKEEIGGEIVEVSKDHLWMSRRQGASSNEPSGLNPSSSINPQLYQCQATAAEVRKRLQIVPRMDPMAEMHPDIASALRRWGHTEDADGVHSDSSNRSINDEQAKSEGYCKRFWKSLVSLPYYSNTCFAPYASYSTEHHLQPYYRRYAFRWKKSEEETIFAQKDRIHLTVSLIRRHINVDALIVKTFLRSPSFPLHDSDALDYFKNNWWCSWHQPLNKIRMYFGEKIALYFAWLWFYTKMLIVPTVVGIISLGWQRLNNGCFFDKPIKRDASTSDEDARCIIKLYVVFVSVVIIRSSLFCSLWRRQNAILNLLWGSYRSVLKTHVRPPFRGKPSFNVVTDQDEVVYKEELIDRFARACAAALVIMVMITIVLYIQYVLYAMNIDFTSSPTTKHAILSDNAISQRTWATTPSSSLAPVQKKDSDSKTKNALPEQVSRKPYDDDEAANDYSEMVIQFGYVTLFYIACPLAPALALLNNVAEARIDAYKLCCLYRRPFPAITANIGAWRHLLTFTMYASFATNAGILLYTSDLLPEDQTILSEGMLSTVALTERVRAATLVGLVATCIFISLLVDVAIPAEPAELSALRERFDHIEARVFNGIRVVDKSSLNPQSPAQPAYPRSLTTCVCVFVFY